MALEVGEVAGEGLPPWVGELARLARPAFGGVVGGLIGGRCDELVDVPMRVLNMV
jgi:hypothetical protein